MSEYKQIFGGTKIPVFKRKEFVTRCADPTEVVMYTHDDLGVTITEFQGVYMTEVQSQVNLLELVNNLGAALHDALEQVHSMKPYYEAAMEE